MAGQAKSRKKPLSNDEISMLLEEEDSFYDDPNDMIFSSDVESDSSPNDHLSRSANTITKNPVNNTYEAPSTLYHHSMTEVNPNKKGTVPMEEATINSTALDTVTGPDGSSESGGVVPLVNPIANVMDLKENISLKKSRKRLRDPENWVRNKRKKQKEAGQAYTSAKGKAVPPKRLKTLKDCNVNCKFQCSKNCSLLERQQIFEHFYSLDLYQKRCFILSTTKCVKKERLRTKNDSSRRSNSIFYYLKLSGAEIRVCKPFYLGTLSISQKVIYNAHKNKDSVTQMPLQSKWGKHQKTNISEVRVAEVISHIKSFPAIESHYCRQRTKKEYLSPDLNVSKMYDLYLEFYSSAIDFQPVKREFYRHIFMTRFNLDFHVPKSDRCDLCEEVMVAKKENRCSKELEDKHTAHLEKKNAMREEKKKDKEAKTDCLLMFDLQNVISCPRADISSFFYKRKLNIYNLTAYEERTKQGYCAIWSELVGGRAGNDIASALMRILDKVVEARPSITAITTWSDSCTPQNRNSVMSFAVIDFLRRHPTIQSFTMKFSVPGHSCVQEVDNMHSHIEKSLRVSEIFSPFGLLRILSRIRQQKQYKIIQMQKDNFKDYQSCSKSFQYAKIPFTKVAQLQFEQNQLQAVTFTESHSHTTPPFTVLIKPDLKTRKQQEKEGRIDATQLTLPTPKTNAKQVKLDPSKQKDLKDMFKFMSAVDREYYECLGVH